jgi:hypothetical protein
MERNPYSPPRAPLTKLDEVAPVSIVRYAGIFIETHFCAALLLGTLIPMTGISRPHFLGVWVIIGAGYLVSYIFARQRRRIFTSGEKWRLVGYCSTYLALCEFYAQLGARLKMVNPSVGQPPDIAISLATVALGSLVDILILVVLLEFGAPRMMRSYLQG